jgi:hypothetical protein
MPQIAAYRPSAKSRNTLSNTMHPNSMSRLKTLQHMHRTIIDGTTRDGAESSNRQQNSAAGRPPLLGSDRPGEHTPDDSSARYQQAERALQAAYSLPKRAASKAMTTQLHLAALTHGSSTRVLRQGDSTQVTR